MPQIRELIHPVSPCSRTTASPSSRPQPLSSWSGVGLWGHRWGSLLTPPQISELNIRFNELQCTFLVILTVPSGVGITALSLEKRRLEEVKELARALAFPTRSARLFPRAARRAALPCGPSHATSPRLVSPPAAGASRPCFVPAADTEAKSWFPQFVS